MLQALFKSWMGVLLYALLASSRIAFAQNTRSWEDTPAPKGPGSIEIDWKDKSKVLTMTLNDTFEFKFRTGGSSFPKTFDASIYVASMSPSAIRSYADIMLFHYEYDDEFPHGKLR